MPPAIPVTIPAALTVAMPVAVLLHAPPPMASLKEVVLPAHKTVVPDIGDGAVGSGFTVTIEVTAAEPHPLDSV